MVVSYMCGADIHAPSLRFMPEQVYRAGNSWWSPFDTSVRTRTRPSASEVRSKDSTTCGLDLRLR